GHRVARRLGGRADAAALDHDRSETPDGSAMYVLTWLWGLLRRRPMRVAGTVAGIAIAVALLGSLGAFFAASKAHMTKRAVSGVIVDWQGRVTPRPHPVPARPALAPPP